VAHPLLLPTRSLVVVDRGSVGHPSRGFPCWTGTPASPSLGTKRWNLRAHSNLWSGDKSVSEKELVLMAGVTRRLWRHLLGRFGCRRRPTTSYSRGKTPTKKAPMILTCGSKNFMARECLASVYLSPRWKQRPRRWPRRRYFVATKKFPCSATRAKYFWTSKGITNAHDTSKTPRRDTSAETFGPIWVDTSAQECSQEDMETALVPTEDALAEELMQR